MGVWSHSLLIEIQRTLLDAGFCQTGDLREPFRIGDGDVGQDLAVDLDIGLFETENEAAVGPPVQSLGIMDTCNPSVAEITFLYATIPEGIIECPVNSFGSTAEQLAPCAPVTLGKFQYLVTSASRFKTSFNAWHLLLLRVLISPDPQGETVSSRFLALARYMYGMSFAMFFWSTSATIPP